MQGVITLELLIGLCFGIFLHDLFVGIYLRRKIDALNIELTALKRELSLRRLWRQ